MNKGKHTPWAKGQPIYYHAPKTGDTVPAEVRIIESYHRICGDVEISLLIRGDFPTGDRSQWVKAKYCVPQEVK